MNLTLSSYIGDGTRRNPFRTKVEGASIDLRPDDFPAAAAMWVTAL